MDRMQTEPGPAPESAGLARGQARRFGRLRAGLRRVAVATVGGLIVLVGVALLVLPGPGWALIFAGLALLSTEFSWAGRALTWLRGTVAALSSRVREEVRRRAGRSRTAYPADAADTAGTPSNGRRARRAR